MKNTKKTIIGILIASGLAVGSITIKDKMDCDYTLKHEGEEYCITKEIKVAIESGLKQNSGFGGVKFNE